MKRLTIWYLSMETEVKSIQYMHLLLLFLILIVPELKMTLGI
jgi:hypothetical protein